MDQNGITVRDLAKAMEVSTPTITRWLAGEREPRWDSYQFLRDNLPGFADLMDR